MRPQLTLSQIGQISVSVKDVERATAFYRDRLGMRHLFTARPGLSFFDCSGVRLQSAHRTLTGRGVRFHDAPHLIAEMDTYDLWMAFFYDSEDNMMGLMSEVPKPSAG